MHKVEVFYVLCLFLTGKHKLIVSVILENFLTHIQDKNTGKQCFIILITALIRPLITLLELTFKDVKMLFSNFIVKFHLNNVSFLICE